MPSQHRPGSLKQQNKKHKSVSGKRSQRKALGAGKVETSANGSVGSARSSKTENSRTKRINQSIQLRAQKKSDAWLAKRIGSSGGPPRIVALVPLSRSVDTAEVLRRLIAEEISDSAFDAESRVVYGSLKKHRTKFAFVQSFSNRVMDVIDVARVADVVMFVANAPAQLGNSSTNKIDDGSQVAQNFSDMIDEEGATFLTALRSLGFPSLMLAVNGLSVTGPSAIQINARRLKELSRFIEYSITSDIRILDAGDVSNVARQLSTMPIGREISWRAHRSYLVADKVEVVAESESEGKTLVVNGFIRGNPLYIHSLAHLCGVGTTRIARVEVIANVHAPLSSRWRDPSAASLFGVSGEFGSSTGTSSTFFEADKSLQDSLVMTANGDVLSGEQTWPSEEEIAQATTNGDDTDIGRNRRNVAEKSVPVGMSSYQADWYLDESGNFDAEAAAEAAAENDEGLVDGIIEDTTEVKRRQQQDELAFPDEMDTPADVLARVRFARFRALQSFRSSPWHPKENLPPSYSSIFEFEDFGGMQRRVLNEMQSVLSMQNQDILSIKKKKAASSSGSIRPASDSLDMQVEDEGTDGDNGTSMDEADNEVGAALAGSGEDDNEDEMDDNMDDENEGRAADPERASGVVTGADDYIAAGQYVRIWLDNVHDLPEDLVQKLPTDRRWKSLTLFSLMPHENKLSVLNYNIQRVDSETTEDPIKSKDELLFLSGFRSFVGRPVFSEANLNCDKNKMERFLLHNRFSMATVFGPITYMPCPLLVFKQTGETLKLVANGALNSVNPDRIVLKKVILTGHPIRVKKRFAVVKHLFHDPNDVRWFKPAEITTKHGLRGHITEPVGTHGLLKAQFNNPITQNDTVMLVLFKRVFPKFPAAGITPK